MKISFGIMLIVNSSYKNAITIRIIVTFRLTKIVYKILIVNSGLLPQWNENVYYSKWKAQ